MKPKLCLSVPVQMKKTALQSSVAFMLVLLCSCLSSFAQQPLKGVAMPYQGGSTQPNYQTFPGERMSPETWAKTNPGKVYTAQTLYKTFTGDSVKYVEVVSKRTAYESFYINAEDPASYTKVKGLRPINFQRNGEWIPIDLKLRPMGNGIYEAPDQWDPVGVNIAKNESYIKTPEGKVTFNNWSLYGIKGSSKVLLGKADWSHYTIGEDGILITGIFPGIDAEMRVRTGGVKTSFIVHRLDYAQYESLYFEDSFTGLSGDGLYFFQKKDEDHKQETVHANVASLSAAIRISHAFAFSKKEPSVINELPFTLSKNKLGFTISARYLEDRLASGDVVIDPLVESFNSISQALVGFMYNASCGFSNSCDYTISLAPPDNSTVTAISIWLHLNSTAPCQNNNFAFQTSVGTCVSPGPGAYWYAPGATYSGEFNSGYFNQDQLTACAPAPACTPASIDVNIRLFRGCVGPIDCDNTCIGFLSPLSIRIQGRTAELTPITATPNDSLCLGQNFTFNTSPIYGVPPYSAVDWSFNPSGVPSLGTGNTLTTGSTLAAGNHIIYARTMDACGTLATASLPFVVLQPVVTAPDQVICSDAIYNAPLTANYPGTTYSWTVVQTGVTGASNGTGAAISDTLVNSGSTPGTVIYTITPLFSGCTGLPVIHTVTVNPAPRVLYVDGLNGDDGNCGDAWTSSLKTVNQALKRANASTNVDSILVAAGTYYPTVLQNGTDRDSSLVITDDRLKLYGGYPNGGGTRNIAANPTILSGDIGVLDDSLDNSFHVMVIPLSAVSAVDSIVVDGFTITNGNANGTASFNYETIACSRIDGGGIYIKNALGNIALRNLEIRNNTAAQLGGGINMLFANPSIDNCTFLNNRAGGGGGLTVETSARPTVTECNFIGNIAAISGGGVYNQNATATPTYVRCGFIDNIAGSPTAGGWGGGMSTRAGANVIVRQSVFTGNTASSGGAGVMNENSSQVLYERCAFVNNRSGGGPGGVGTGGGVQSGSSSNVQLIDCVVANNIAGGPTDDGGGGLMLYSTSTITCINTTVSGNTTTSTTKPNSGGISSVAGTTLNFRNSIVWGPGNQYTTLGAFNYSYAIIKGLAATLPNLNLDPLFVDASNPIGPDGIYRTADDGLVLTECSPAVNMGSNGLAVTAVDITGNPRIANTTVDMGAYELPVIGPNILFTDIVKTYGDPDAAVSNVTSCSGLPLTFTIDDNNIATIVGGNLHLVNAGTTTIRAQAPNGTPEVAVTLTVNPRPVTVSLTATPIVKIYDGNTIATVTAANLQLAPGDVIGTDNVVIALSSNVGSYDTKDVGIGKLVTVPLANISLTGTSAANYVIVNTTDVSANPGVINPLQVTVTADVQTKEYGDTDPVLTYTYSPALAPGDAFTGSLERVPGETPGIYPINQGTLALDANYTLVYAGNNLIISPKMITVTAEPKTKIYGDTDPALTYTYAPALVGTDVFTGSLIRVPGENIGNYAINQGSLTLGTNYNITYISSNLTITPRAITVTADPQTKVYGDPDPSLTYTFTPALVGTDAFTGALTRVPGENAGTYAINQGSLGLSANYTVTYVGDNLTITPKAVTVTADPQTKIYGDADPVLTYTVTPALVGTDAFTGSLTRVAGENVGTYAINQGSLALSTNYTITYVPDNLTITKAVLTVTANDRTICFGDPITGFTVSYSGFKFTDNVSSLSSQPTVVPPIVTIPGNYPILPSGGAALNYSFNYVEGQLTVLPSPAGVITQTYVGPPVVTTPGVTSGVQLTAPLGTGYTYEWNTGQRTSAIFVTSNGQFSVIVTNSLGCRTFFVIVVKQQTLIIPNIFSPNGDGINDKWVIGNLQNYPGSVVQIFNRYGQAVQKMVNYQPWDGRINGKDMPVGTYYYVIDLKNGQKPVSGYIDIIR